jgi:hypothetical protein
VLARLAVALHLDMRLLASLAYPKLHELFDSGDRNQPPPKLQAWRDFMSGYHKRHNVTEADERVLYESTNSAESEAPAILCTS